jgi:hypothetical protein
MEVIAIVVNAQDQDSVDWGDLKYLEASELGKKKHDLQVFMIKWPWRHEIQVLKNEARRSGLDHSISSLCNLVVLP